MAKKKNKKSNWIKKIVPGALHKLLGIPAGKKVPTDKLKKGKKKK